jgi:hypothetical protein
MPTSVGGSTPEGGAAVLPPASWRWSGSTAHNRSWQRAARAARTKADSLLSDMESLLSEIARDVAAQWTL